MWRIREFSLREYKWIGEEYLIVVFLYLYLRVFSFHDFFFFKYCQSNFFLLSWCLYPIILWVVCFSTASFKYTSGLSQFGIWLLWFHIMSSYKHQNLKSLQMNYISHIVSPAFLYNIVNQGTTNCTQKNMHGQKRYIFSHLYIVNLMA